MPILAFVLSNWKWVLLGILVAAIGVQTFRLDLCQSGRHKDQVAAEAKIIELQGSLQAQNEAIAKIAKDSAERKAKAEKGLQEAQKQAQGARSEAARLRGLASAPQAPSGSQACPAGQAVQEIRKGLSRP